MSVGIDIDGSKWGLTVQKTLFDYLQNGTFCDTTIISSDEKSINAHSCIIAAASPVLRDLLNDSNCAAATITASIPARIWNVILRFIYLHKITISPQDAFSLKDIYRAASALQLRGLQEALKKKFVPQLLVTPGEDLNDVDEDEANSEIVIKEENNDDHADGNDDDDDENEDMDEDEDSLGSATEEEEDGTGPLATQYSGTGAQSVKEMRLKAILDNKRPTYEAFFNALEASRCCVYCRKYFKSTRVKVVHYMNHLKRKPFHKDFKKRFSDSKFFTLIDYVERQSSVNTRLKSVCWRCQEIFSNRQLYNNHMWKKHDKYPFNCTYCEELYTYHSQLLMHKRKKHNHELLK